MCLIGIRIDDDGGLLIAANRDEFADRPTQALHWWKEGILAGKDLRAGGTWLGLTRDGRFAAVTNVRDPVLHQSSLPQESRGLLVTRYLQSNTTPRAFVDTCLASLSQPSPFNLIVGQVRRRHADQITDCWWVGGRVRRAEAISPGVNVLSNAELNTPWPKALRLQSALHRADPIEVERALRSRETADDHLLPDTGVAVDWERRLSAALITGDEYHTRSTTLVRVALGTADVREITWSPDGEVYAEASEEFTLDPSVTSPSA